MSTGIETVDLIEPWLYATLSGDEKLRALVGENVGGPLLVEAVDPPYVTWSDPSVRDRSGVAGQRLWVDTIYTVKAVAATASWDDVAPIAHRIDALLHGADVTTAEGEVTCRREGVVQYGEVTDGQSYRHLGGRFRIKAYAALGLTPVPAPGPVTPAPTPGAPTAGVDPSSFVYTQATAAASWSFTHPLGRMPSVALYVGDEEVDADVNATTTSVHVVFPAPTAGIAVLS